MSYCRLGAREDVYNRTSLMCINIHNINTNTRPLKDVGWRDACDSMVERCPKCHA